MRAMIPTILIAAASAACPDGNEPVTEFGVSECSTTNITDASSVTEDTLCAPYQLGFSCCAAVFADQDATLDMVSNHHCYNDDNVDGLPDWFGERCTAEDTGILNHTKLNNQFWMIFNCTPPCVVPDELPPEYTRNGCDIGGYTLRYAGTDPESSINVTLCLNDCTGHYFRQSEEFACKVSNEEHPCCHSNNDVIMCNQYTESECDAHDDGQWCRDPVTPAPPADDSGLSAGAIAGIAVGAVLVVVAAGVVLL